MSDKLEHLRDLQERLRRGDRAAEGELRQELEPWIALMIRRAMRLPGAGSPLEALVQAEIDRLPAFAANRRACESPRIIRHIAQRIALTVVDRLRSPTLPHPRAEGRSGEARWDTVRDRGSVRERL